MVLVETSAHHQGPRMDARRGHSSCLGLLLAGLVSAGAALACGDGYMEVEECPPGKVRDAETGECVPEGEVDPCEDVSCGENAYCDEGDCVCALGFEGDPDSGCEPVPGCEGVTCGENAYCDEGDCVCVPGFEGDPHAGCQPMDSCEGVSCGANAYCEGGSCSCLEGFEGDPYAGCQPVDPCEGVSCGANAHCDGGSCFCLEGFEGDPNAGCHPVDPCEAVTCGANAYCDDGSCVCAEGYQGDAEAGCTPIPACGEDGCGYAKWCDGGLCRCKWGFSSQGDECVRDPVTPPAERTREEVCSTWTETSFSYERIWEIEPVDDCDWGYLHASYHHAAIGTLSLYRWLVGLEAVASTEHIRTITQACATTLAAENAGLTHSIPSDYACYTSEAASGAGSSNLAMGTDAIGSVALYIQDPGTPSLGHRRWIFNPTMLDTAFGYRGQYSCQYAFSYSGSHRPEFVAYPAAGYFPANAIHGPWSVSSSAWGIGSNVEVELVRLSDDAEVAVQDVRFIAGDMVRDNTVSFRPSVLPGQGVERNEEH